MGAPRDSNGKLPIKKTGDVDNNVYEKYEITNKRYNIILLYLIRTPINANAALTISFSKSKAECYNCRGIGHVAGECIRRCKICLNVLGGHHAFYDCPQYVFPKGNINNSFSNDRQVKSLASTSKRDSSINDLLEPKNTVIMAIKTAEVLLMSQCLNHSRTEKACDIFNYGNKYYSSYGLRLEIPDYFLISLDEKKIVDFFQGYFDAGFQINELPSSSTRQQDRNAPMLFLQNRKRLDKDITFEDLRNGGTKILDAIYFLNSTCQREKWRLSKKEKEDVLSYQNNASNTKKKEAEALVYLFFFILIKGVAPSRDARKNDYRVSSLSLKAPFFLKQVMNLSENPIFYCNRLASFNINDMDSRWIKSADFGLFKSGVFKQMHMDIAGHRFLDIFKTFEPKNNLSNVEMKTYQELKRFAMAGPHWDVHSITRAIAYTSFFGNPDQLLYSLVKKYYTEKKFQDLCSSEWVPNNFILSPKHSSRVFLIKENQLSQFESPIFG